MGIEHLERKLAAILYADVAGYSRLTGEDEDATHRTLSAYLDLLSKTIEDHRGRVMHYAGDAVLAKFNAVVDALSCAVAIQTDLRTRNQDLPDERRVQFRIGVNLGDVIEDRGDIYGEGVNVAALDEGVVRSARDGDIGAVFGIGFPPFRGGPLRYLDEIGAAQAVATLEELSRDYGDRVAPAPRLKRMAERDESFYLRS